VYSMIRKLAVHYQPIIVLKSYISEQL
jgi:hypothetical protein